jgi:hypothetical protein
LQGHIIYTCEPVYDSSQPICALHVASAQSNKHISTSPAEPTSRADPHLNMSRVLNHSISPTQSKPTTDSFHQRPSKYLRSTSSKSTQPSQKAQTRKHRRTSFSTHHISAAHACLCLCSEQHGTKQTNHRLIPSLSIEMPARHIDRKHSVELGSSDMEASSSITQHSPSFSTKRARVISRTRHKSSISFRSIDHKHPERRGIAQSNRRTHPHTSQTCPPDRSLSVTVYAAAPMQPSCVLELCMLC